MVTKVKSNSRIVLAAVLGLGALSAVTGCQKAAPDAATDQKSFTAAPDYNKLTPAQKKMVAQFSHGKVGGPPPDAGKN